MKLYWNTHIMTIVCTFQLVFNPAYFWIRAVFFLLCIETVLQDRYTNTLSTNDNNRNINLWDTRGGLHHGINTWSKSILMLISNQFYLRWDSCLRHIFTAADSNFGWPTIWEREWEIQIKIHRSDCRCENQPFHKDVIFDKSKCSHKLWFSHMQ